MVKTRSSMGGSALWLTSLLTLRVLQWASAVIVMGITSAFIDQGPRVLINIYTEVIACISVVVFGFALASPFLSEMTMVKRIVLQLDIWMSYLWITSFIFEGLAYENAGCATTGANSPCSQKKANQSFTFFAFIFTFFAIMIQVVTPWLTERREHPNVHEKGGHLQSNGGHLNGDHQYAAAAPANTAYGTPASGHPGVPGGTVAHGTTDGPVDTHEHRTEV